MILVCVVSCVPSAVWAQQPVCYAYDALGRLIAVMDPQGRAAIYDYDPIGNLLAIRRQDTTGPVAVILVDPRFAKPATPVDIFGIGFSDIAANNQVTVDGITAPIVAASRCGVTVDVPSGATAGAIVVTTPLGSATANVAVVDIVISPTATTVVGGTNLQFTATITGCSDTRVAWSVNGIVGGSAPLGMITSAGLYKAPTVMATVTVRAQSLGCPGLFDETMITVTNPHASTYHTDPLPTVSNPNPNLTVLHKELAGYPNYGVADGAADILYSTQRDLWTFDLSSLPTKASIVSAKVRLSLVLDDHYSRPATDYVGRIFLNGSEVFSGGFATLSVAHGTPFGERFVNWKQVEFPIGDLSPSAYTVHIMNDTSGSVFGDWIAIDYIELELSY